MSCGGRGRWSDGNGDTPYDQYDAALGLGWRFRRDVELRGEVRTVVYDEPGSDPDDFSAGILTVSVHWSF